MSRLIDADALQKEYQKEHGKRLLLIDVAPTIDAVERSEYEKMKDLAEQYKFERYVLEESQRNKVEVVRCKDCKHWKGNDEPIAWNDGKIFIKVPCETKPTDFCSMGERKEDND